MNTITDVVYWIIAGGVIAAETLIGILWIWRERKRKRERRGRLGEILAPWLEQSAKAEEQRNATQ